MHIVIVEASAPRSFDLVEEFAAAGIEVTFLTEDLRRYAGTQGFDRHKLAARVLEVPGLRQDENVAELVRDRLGPNPPDGVLCCHDHYLVAAGCLARDLGLPHEAVSTLRLVTDKAAVRERLSAAGIGTLRWRCVSTSEEGLRAAADIGYPVVVKPVAGRMSVDVSVVWNEQQAAGVLTGALKRAHVKRLLVEEYAVGRGVAAQVLVQGGRPLLLGFGESLPSRADTTVELGGHFPARFEQRGACRQFVRDVVRALGIRDSALHIELVVTATGPELIEVNGRIAGYVIPRQMSLALDRSIGLDLAALCTGGPVADLAEPVSYVALRNLCSDRSGIVRDARIPADLPGEVTDCFLTVRPGDRVVPARHNSQRIGYVLAKGFTSEAAARTADEAFARIREHLAVDGVPDDREETSGPGGAPADGDRYGPHVVLLLDADSAGPAPERILTAAGAATGQVSVLWCGARQAPPGVRESWARRHAGRWRDVAQGAGAAEALRELDAAHPVAAVVAFTPGLTALRDRIVAADGDGATTPGTARQRQPAAPGHIVLSLVADGVLRHLDVLDDLGTDPDGHRTLCSPSVLTTGMQNALRSAAERAVAASGVGSGTVRCFFPAGSADASADVAAAPVAVLPGLDEATRAVYDAAHARDVVTLTLAAALGGRGRSAVPPRSGAAMVRTLAAPPGDFRVVAASTADDLCDHPEVVHAHAPLSAGDVHTGEERVSRLTYAVAGRDLDACRAAVRRVESAVLFRHTPLDRTHVVIIDRLGAVTWTRQDGTAVLPPERFRVSILSGGEQVAGPGSAPADFALRTDVFDHEATARIVRELHRSHPVHRIAAASERLLAPAAELRGALRLPGDTRTFTRSLLDKAEMKRLARRAGIAHAEGMVLYEPADAHRMLDEYGAVVLKPRELSGSQGVAICTDRPTLQQWLDERFVPGGYLVERRVSGPMCHIDALVHDSAVVAWDVSQYWQDGLAVARGHPFSSQTVADPLVRERAGDLLERVVAGWGMRSAVLHMEAFAEGDRLVFCEVAGRPGGAGIVEAFVVTRGIDLRHAKVLMDAGEDPRTLAQDPVAAHAGWTVHYSPGGVLHEFDDSAVADRAHFRKLNTTIGGSLARSTYSGTGLSTHVFAGDSSAEVQRLLTAAQRDIHIVMKPHAAADGE